MADGITGVWPIDMVLIGFALMLIVGLAGDIWRAIR